MYKLSNNFKDFVKSHFSDNKQVGEIISIIIAQDASIAKLKDYLLDHPNVLELIKLDALQYLLLYVNDTLKDDCITSEELNDFLALKRIFDIKQGDFFKYKEFEVQEILQQQFLRMYSDHFIDQNEAITQVNLQIMFDLSFDEFEKLKKQEVIQALLNGADPKHLDISFLPKGFKL